MRGVARTLVAWRYEGAARDLVLALKLRGIRAAADPLADAAAAAVHAAGLRGDVLAWVPCRASDERRRGFDHAELIARRLGERLGLPVRPLVVRLRNPPDQASLGRAARRANLAGTFGARPCGGRIVLVDDLVTTGATGAACAAALRAGGAAGVELVAPCRA